MTTCATLVLHEVYSYMTNCATLVLHKAFSYITNCATLVLHETYLHDKLVMLYLYYMCIVAIMLLHDFV